MMEMIVQMWTLGPTRYLDTHPMAELAVLVSLASLVPLCLLAVVLWLLLLPVSRLEQAAARWRAWWGR
jgi:hypothetical protein